MVYRTSKGENRVGEKENKREMTVGDFISSMERTQLLPNFIVIDLILSKESIQRRLHSLRLKTQAAETEDDDDGIDPASLRKHEKYTKVKNIPFIELGRYEIETWYFSPFPTKFDNSPMLYICEFFLHYMKRREQRQSHMQKCDLRHPPGNEIYRSGELSMFEVDGEENRVYCQNLCHMAKLFLDHKTLLDDVEDFPFYILCECDERGCHMVAYFSKAKQSAEPYNIACILTLPPYQRKGYGKFLIAFYASQESLVLMKHLDSTSVELQPFSLPSTPPVAVSEMAGNWVKSHGVF